MTRPRCLPATAPAHAPRVVGPWLAASKAVCGLSSPCVEAEGGRLGTRLPGVFTVLWPHCWLWTRQALLWGDGIFLEKVTWHLLATGLLGPS